MWKVTVIVIWIVFKFQMFSKKQSEDKYCEMLTFGSVSSAAYLEHRIGLKELN